MRAFSLMFVFIALALLAQFLIYVTRGPVDLVIAAVIFTGFLVCLAPALYLLKPFGSREDLRRRRMERAENRRHVEDKGPPQRNG